MAIQGIDEGALYVTVEKYDRDGKSFYVPSLRGAVYYEGSMAGEECNQPTREAAIAWVLVNCAYELHRKRPTTIIFTGERGGQYQAPAEELRTDFAAGEPTP